MRCHDIPRELDRRTDDGVDARLLWRSSDDRVTVAVLDTVTGDAFTVEVRAGDRALDVLRHPFAYAAWRGIDTSGVDTAPVLAALRAL